jgi:hypothetical protein
MDFDVMILGFNNLALTGTPQQHAFEKIYQILDVRKYVNSIIPQVKRQLLGV